MSLKTYLNTFTSSDIDSTYGYLGNGCTVYKNLFKSPVELVFFWNENDWSGSIFAIYKYNETYVIAKGTFGSCSGCDPWEGKMHLDTLNNNLERIYNNLEYTPTLSGLQSNFQYFHPDLLDKFKAFIDQ